MKIAFISNFFNHHQKYISDELFKRSDVEYRFISTTEMPEERSKLGYNEFENVEYVIQAYKSEEDRNLALDFIASANVIIYGSVDTNVIPQNVFKDKLVFRYSERPLKEDKEWIKYPIRFYRWHFKEKINKTAYLLCASAFAASDFAKFGMFKGRTYKWGYFPEARIYDIDQLLSAKHESTILWCGRLLDWKHPDDAIMVAKKLKADGYSFSLQLIGNGEMHDKLFDMVKEYSLEDCVYLLGAKPSDEVRERMEQADIYLFTSDKREGWGAVLNESMNSACAVVASGEIGAVPYLIDDGANGIIYQDGNVDDLYCKVKSLLDNAEYKKQIQYEAYKTITQKWNAKNAVNQLVKLIEQIIYDGKITDCADSGPCSKAE